MKMEKVARSKSISTPLDTRNLQRTQPVKGEALREVLRLLQVSKKMMTLLLAQK